MKERGPVNDVEVILDAAYSKVDIDETVDLLDNINDDVKLKLKTILKKPPKCV
jgi:hypothetical protein